jgi:GT2 family glycosyltransferase
VQTQAPEVQLVRNPDNLRFAAGNNAGAAAALERGARTLVLLNNDTTIEPHLLRELSRSLEEDSDLGIVGPRICYADRAEVIWYGGGILDLWSGLPRHRALRKSAHAGQDPEGSTHWVTGCTLAVRREVWEALSGLDSGFYMYGEDVDFCLRARAAGWKVGYNPQGTVFHAVSASVGGNETPFKAYHKVRSRRAVVRRHASVAQRALASVAMLGHDVAWMGWLVLKGAPGAALAVVQGWLDREHEPPRYRV